MHMHVCVCVCVCVHACTHCTLYIKPWQNIFAVKKCVQELQVTVTIPCMQLKGLMSGVAMIDYRKRQKLNFHGFLRIFS